jgi:glutamine amidotransferase
LFGPACSTLLRLPVVAGKFAGTGARLVDACSFSSFQYQGNVAMCRWIAYTGSAVPLSELLTCPNHSLIVQSLHATENVGVTTNGDGFGVGWYGEGNDAGIFRDTHPAWNNANLLHLTRHVRSPLFMAHVRAASGTAVQNSNCHPFMFRNWLFQHNGYVPEFQRLKRMMLLDVNPELFPSIEGSTDSEILFFLALTFGLDANPQQALERMVGHVEKIRHRAGSRLPFTLSAAASDGKKLYAIRYATGGNAPTLYHSRHVHALKVVDGSYETLPDDAVVIVSEPLDELAEHWERIPESSLVIAERGETRVVPFIPDPG